MTDSNKITSFRGKYFFLSNFYPCFVNFEGARYPSVEHAFQAAKTLNLNDRKSFEVIRAASEAKRAGRQVSLRSDWNEVRESVMLQCLRSKFSNEDLRKMLISTGDAILEEGNNHGAKFWGTVNGQGDNRLGKLLMKVREEIR